MREWESDSDPLFAAAEVVQYSADRMDSIFRLLLHEQSLVQGDDHTDRQLLSYIESHQRDLATALETAKWQLEDFESEVNVSAKDDKFQLKQNVIRTQMQFIRAIREQIIHVERSMNTSVGNSWKDMNTNEQDKDGFALFLSGEDPVEHSSNPESKEEYILDHNLELKNFPMEMDLGPSVSFEEAKSGRYDKEGTWDLEANHAKGRSYLQKNKLRNYFGRLKVFGSVGNLLSSYKRRGRISFTKRLKDWEEQRQTNIHPGMQGYTARLGSAIGCSNFPSPCSKSSSWISGYREQCQRSIDHIQARYHPLPSIFALLLTLLILNKRLNILQMVCWYNFRGCLF